MNGASNSQDAVAFALSEVFSLHSDDREDRPVTGNDNYLLMANGSDVLSEAVSFIDGGGNADDAIRIIAALARLTPDRLYGRWSVLPS